MRRNCQGFLIRDIFLEEAEKTVHFMHQIHRNGALRIPFVQDLADGHPVA